jgi:hypothetical protein
LEPDLFTTALVELWGVLLDLSEYVPHVWSLIGGQMVLLHGLEHGRTPSAASADLDVLADVQSDQQSLRRLVAALERLGFAPAGMSPQGNLLHRYHRGEEPGRLVVDLLAPDNLGPRADLTTTPPGRTLEVPGGRQAVQRMEAVRVQLGQRIGHIRRPNLLGAIVAKAAALSIKTAPPDAVLEGTDGARRRGRPSFGGVRPGAFSCASRPEGAQGTLGLFLGRAHARGVICLT